MCTTCLVSCWYTLLSNELNRLWSNNSSNSVCDVTIVIRVNTKFQLLLGRVVINCRKSVVCNLALDLLVLDTGNYYTIIVC